MEPTNNKAPKKKKVVKPVSYSPRFKSFVSKTISFETDGDKNGAYTEDPRDAGGATKWGISQKAHPDLNIKALTYTQAVDIYYKQYWNPLYDSISNPLVAFTLFDMGVLCGPQTVVKILQEKLKANLVIDGKFGPKTLAELQLVGPEFIEHFKAGIKGYFYRTLIKRPTNIRYIKGWLKRLSFSEGVK